MDENVFKTTDLALCAYIKMRSQVDNTVKMKFLKYRKINESRKIEFSLSDPDNQADNVTVEFLNSESKQFDSEVRDLKKLLF